MDRATSITIITTLDDTLATLQAYANQKFENSLAKAQTTNMYALSSAKIVHAVGGHTLPGGLLLLNQDTLKMVLMCVKQSSQLEQLFVAFNDDVAEEATAGSHITAAMEGNRAENGDDTQDQPSASEAGKDRDRPPDFNTARKNQCNPLIAICVCSRMKAYFKSSAQTQHDTQQGLTREGIP